MKDRFQIRIDSILGGHALSTHFAEPDQYRTSFAIDPSMPVDNGDGVYSSIASGLLRPVGANSATTTTTASIMWFAQNPKKTSLSESFAVDTVGSMYTVSGSGSPTGISDGGNESGTGSGNGCAYYDNYVYFAKNTTIARYGPLNGTPVLDGDYWGTTLAKTALTHTPYPGDTWPGEKYSNHVLHRHSDGRLYIADVVGNTGTIHFIQTTKTTIEGDTDNGSTYDKLNVGYGLHPIAMESYGSDLVIAFNEAAGSDNATYSQRAKIAFWDTTSTDVNQITWVEFPDEFITAIKNINGVLYIFSGSMDDFGFRITRYIGGYSFEEVVYSEMGFAPHAGAVIGRGNNLYFGTAQYPMPEPSGSRAVVYSLNLKKSRFGRGLFCIARPGGNPNIGRANGVTALEFEAASNFNQTALHAATDYLHIDRIFQSSLEASPIWWSQTYKIGQPFKITKIRIPTLESISTLKKQIVPRIYFDNGRAHKTLMTMDYDVDNLVYTIRPENAVGKHEFFLELKWSGMDVLLTEKGGTWTVGLPITIEYELLDD